MNDAIKEILSEQEKRFQEMEDLLRRYNDSIGTKNELPAPKFDRNEFIAMRRWQQERMANLSLE